MLEEAFFFTPPAEARRRLAQLRAMGPRGATHPDEQREMIRCLCDLALALRSFLPAWRLRTELDSQALASESDACAGSGG